ETISSGFGLLFAIRDPPFPKHNGGPVQVGRLNAGEGVIISQVVPFPWDTSVAVVADYQAALKALDPAAEPGFVSLEGYLTGRLAIEALKAAGAELTRDSFLAAMNGLGTVDFGGVTMTFGPGDNQGMDDVFLTRITQDGGFQPVATGGES
ncbi:ABC transporter substrate-binding protein, partial [Phaeobacter italicus]|uniref:ABC transporter substrate-binding protein n=1 Tax=Phaeobacter italicus TaxID=481446 RepID=UPI0024317A29